MLLFRKKALKMDKFSLRRLQQNWLWLLVNGAGVALSVRAGWMISQAPLLTGGVAFTDDPVLRNIVLFTGKSGLIFLVLSFACTPLARLLGWTPALHVRKALGLWGFAFACLHSLFFLQGKQLFAGLNPGPELWQALQSMIGIVRYSSKIPYTEVGVYALCLLFLLALTSNRLALRRLGKNWKRLHRLVYLAVPLVLYHYWWRTVSPVPVAPPPDSWQVILFGVIVGLLFVVRVPPVRRRLTKTFARMKRNRLPVTPQRRVQPVLFMREKATPPLHERVSTVSPPPMPVTKGAVQQEEQERIIEWV
jgi:methionine sulfoxide reductase heme-binding subunit